MVAKKKVETGEHFLSLDLGNAYANLRTDGDQIDDWRSIMAPLTDANRLGAFPENDVMRYEDRWWATGQSCYTLGQETIEERSHLARYISPWYRRLFAFALHRAFRQHIGKEILYPHVISSIPARLFKNKREADQIKLNLVGQYELGNTSGGTLHVNIPADRLVVIPEGIGTYFGFAFGSNRQYDSGTWMIADFGYLTLDTVMVRDGDYIADAAQSDSQTGISTVSQAVTDYLYSETHIMLDRAAVDEQIGKDCIPVNGKARDISEVRNAALQEMANRATGLLEGWSSRHNLSGLILSGGGAPYIAPFINSDHLPPVTIARLPRRTNVDGAYQYITAG